MRGHIHKRVYIGKGDKKYVTYYAILDTTSPGGKRTQDWGKGFKRKADAEAELNRKLAAVQAGRFVKRSNLTLGEYLASWVEDIGDSIKPTTLAGYRRQVRDYVVPHLGQALLQDLDSVTLSNYLGFLGQKGGRGQRKIVNGKPVQREGRPLASKTVVNVRRLLSKALNDAVARGLLNASPLIGVKKIVARRRRPMQVWDAPQLRDFLGATGDSEGHLLFHLTAYTGMRRGEVAGLRWSNIDFGHQSLSVRITRVLVDGTPVEGTPKSDEARVIDLDEGTVALLAEWREVQNGLRAEWVEENRNLDFVFTRADGSPWHPDRISQAFDLAVRRSGVSPKITFHDLRHTHATILLKAGVPVKVVSERLGHSDPAFTIRTYQHVLPGMQADAAAHFAHLVGSQSERSIRDRQSNDSDPGAQHD